MIHNKLERLLTGAVIFSLGLGGCSLSAMRQEVLLKTEFKNDRLNFFIILLSLRNYYV